MKKITNIIVVVFLVLGATSCEFLDKKPDDQLTMEAVFSDATNTKRWLADIYSLVPDPEWDFLSYNYGYYMMSDEAHMASSLGQFGWGNLMNVQQGSWNPTKLTPSKDLWKETYQKIRAGLLFLENVREIPDQRQTPELVERYKYEVRFLMAYYYSRLLEVYGPFPLITELVDVSQSTEALLKERTPYDEIVDYLDKELLEVSKYLPEAYDDVDVPRPTKGACLAVRAKMLLFAASPLFNGNTAYAEVKNPDGTLLFNQTYDKEKWKKALGATKLVIDMSQYDLYKEYNDDGSIDALMSCTNLYLKGVRENPEIIMNYGPKRSSLYEHHTLPRGSGWAGCISITQNLVDAFFMKNGLSIDEPGSGYQATGFSSEDTYYNTNYNWADANKTTGLVTRKGTFNMYVNREPRFYVNVRYHGQYCSFDDVKRDLNFLNGGSDGAPSHDSPIAGYQINKALYPGMRSGSYPYTPGIIIRLGEMYLNYAEALTEYNYEANKAEAQKYVNLIRERAGLPNLKTSLTKDEMIEAILKERRVEFAFEGGVRYMDIRRRKIMDKVFRDPIRGMNTSAKTNAEYFKEVEIQTRAYLEKMYLWPIHQNYIDNSHKLVQNKGY